MRPTGLASLRLLILAIAALIVSLGPSPDALAKDQSARQFLQAIYASYGSNGDGVRWRGSKTGQYFDQTLTKLIAKDLKESEGEVGRIDADPFVYAQDFDISSLTIDILSEGAQRAKAVVSFTNLSEPTRVEFDLVNTSQGWRIANITWPDGGTLRDVLSGPLAP
jgi:hypothetical protein